MTDLKDFSTQNIAFKMIKMFLFISIIDQCCRMFVELQDQSFIKYLNKNALLEKPCLFLVTSPYPN